MSSRVIVCALLLSPPPLPQRYSVSQVVADVELSPVGRVTLVQQLQNVVPVAIARSEQQQQQHPPSCRAHTLQPSAHPPCSLPRRAFVHHAAPLPRTLPCPPPPQAG